MAVNDTGDLAGSLVEVLSDAMVHFSKANVTLPLVMQESRDKADTITFPVYNLGSATVTSADVASHSEHDSNEIGATELDSVKKTITLDMFSIRVPIHDEAVLSNANDVTGIAGELVGNAIAAKVDSLIVANFDNFSNTSNDTSNGISVDDIFAGLFGLKFQA